MYPQAYTLKEGTTWAGAMFTGVNTDPYWETVSLCVNVIAYTVYQQQSPINTESFLLQLEHREDEWLQVILTDYVLIFIMRVCMQLDAILL